MSERSIGRVRPLLCLAAFLTVAFSPAIASADADIIFFNARVFTAEARTPLC